MAEITTKEFGDYRIKVFYDEFAPCPAENEDMAFRFFWNYKGSDILSSFCNYDDLYSKPVCRTMSEVVQDLKENMKANHIPKEDFIIREWSSKGYCQGDYVKGVAYMTKQRYAQMVNRCTDNWKHHAEALLDAEVREIGMWMWGDVRGYKLEKKVGYTKQYDDTERPSIHCYDWEEIDSCFGYYLDEDELISEVLKNWGIEQAA